MEDVNLFARSYYGQTTLHPLGLLAIITLGIATLLLPRRYAVWPMLVMACFVSPAQRIAVFTLNFDLLRIMVLFGAIRVVARYEIRLFIWHRMDYVLVAFAVTSTVVYVLQYATADALKYKFGEMYDAIGMYFLFRCLVRDWEDITRLAMCGAIISVPVAVAFFIEHSTGRNLFGFLGGVPLTTMVRDGRLRCQGAFAHPILAGCFWASLTPLIGALWWRGRTGWFFGTTGVCCSFAIIILCASSTPVSAVLFAFAAVALYPMRRWMRGVRWSILAALISLHMMMKMPVWHLIARIDISGGSTGWHRFHLIDQFIRHFDQWWLLGIRSVVEWNVFAGDITNQYVLEGVRGGVIALVLFLILIRMAFARIGRLWRASDGNKPDLYMAWALGVSLFVHCTSFIGVSYFGQINMLWYLTLAMIGSLDATAQVARAPQGVGAQPLYARTGSLRCRPALGVPRMSKRS